MTKNAQYFSLNMCSDVSSIVRKTQLVVTHEKGVNAFQVYYMSEKWLTSSIRG